MMEKLMNIYSHQAHITILLYYLRVKACSPQRFGSVFATASPRHVPKGSKPRLYTLLWIRPRLLAITNCTRRLLC